MEASEQGEAGTAELLPAPAAGRINSLVKLLVPIIVLTVLAAAAGILLGTHFLLPRKPAPEANATDAHPASVYAADTAVLDLKPVVTNLAAPSGAWIRLQAAMIYDRKALSAPDVVAAQIGTDFLGYLKTLSLAQLQGASGLLHLREDLTERAASRSDGRVREIAIEMLVVQ